MALSTKKQDAVKGFVQEQLRPDEHVLFVTAAALGRPDPTKHPTHELKGWIVHEQVRPKAYYVAVTEQRMFLVPIDSKGNPRQSKTGVPPAVARPLTMVQASRSLYAKWDLLNGRGEAVAQLWFEWTVTKRGKDLARALSS